MTTASPISNGFRFIRLMLLPPLPKGKIKYIRRFSAMKIDFVSNNFTGNLIVTVFNIEDIFEVEKALEFIAKFLCKILDYDVDYEYKEISVTVDDYYEYLSLRKLVLDHCSVAA